MSTPFEENHVAAADADYDNSIIEAIRSDKEHRNGLTKIGRDHWEQSLCG